MDMPELAPPIDDRLLRIDADGTPALLAACERDGGRLVFPAPGEAGPDRFERVTLPREGRLWSWTVQRFRPKSPPYAGPEAFEPYAVGYVALGEAIIVEGRLTGAPLDGFAIGMPMRLVAEPFTLESGEQRTTFAFAPVRGSAA
jgi:uncharacterized OB-fold protein